MLLLPRRGLLARAQPDHDIADAHRSTGLERHVARHAVALVEQSERRDALRHRRRAKARVDAATDIDRNDIGSAGVGVERGLGSRLLRRRGGLGRAAGGYRQRRQHHAHQRAANHASGVQAS
ncbi:hypothetical protein GCM10008023_12670 [Sphingomonas glacialis]|uniref:Uncharacterized protein n=1 Tax=Sphingomonas glacialis TaxID=658225 RepID=A0ABQ3LD21_9SPHN|nr:hypothetical protein GCM10008023_12670 [Sphingomonas glacialis]